MYYIRFPLKGSCYIRSASPLVYSYTITNIQEYFGSFDEYNEADEYSEYPYLKIYTENYLVLHISTHIIGFITRSLFNPKDDVLLFGFNGAASGGNFYGKFTEQINNYNQNKILTTKFIDSMTREKNYYAYFASNYSPTFSATYNDASFAISNITITFAARCLLKIFEQDTTQAFSWQPAESQTFELNTVTDKLVYNLKSRSVYIVQNNTSDVIDNYLVLLHLSQWNISGLLAGYFYTYFYRTLINSSKPNQLNTPLAQMYSEYGGLYTEYDLNNKRVWFKIGYIYARVALTNYSAYWNNLDLLDIFGRAGETTPNGYTNCIYLEGAESLTYNNSTKKFSIKDRTEVTLDETIIIMQVSGHIVYINQGWRNADDIYHLINESLNPLDIKYYFNHSAIWKTIVKNSNFNCLFFSDIHGQYQNMNRIVSLGNLFKTNIECIINGGDTVDSHTGEGLDWYNNAITNSTVDILTCVGNHDTWIKNEENRLVATDKQTTYNLCIAPTIPLIQDIHQPNNYAEEFLCYYYKDYNDVRVIVLDAMQVGGRNDYDENQATWFENVLSDALLNNKSVICVNHMPYSKNDNNMIRHTEFLYTSSIDYNLIDGASPVMDIFDKVNMFINNGGDFICWLTGHTHFDNILTHNLYPNQFMINISCAKYTRTDNNSIASSNTPDEVDCINFIGVNTTDKLIRVWRIGHSIDKYLKHHSTFVYNYKTMQLINQN